MTTINLSLDIVENVPTFVETITDESERFTSDTVKLQAGASDISLTLSLLTDPTMIYVEGASGVSFKLAGGTDVIPCNPCALICDGDGFSNASLLLSNSSGVEVDVKVVAIE
jgi:hypothetical protein